MKTFSSKIVFNIRYIVLVIKMSFDDDQDLDYMETLIPYISNHLDWRVFLSHCDFLSYEEKQLIKEHGDSRCTSTEIVEQILKLFLQSDVQHKRKRLQQIMIRMGNEKISNLLERKNLPIRSENKMKINGKLPEICELLGVEDILLELMSKDVLCVSDVNAIRAKLAFQGSWAAAFEMMFRLPGRHTHWFGRFIEALVESHQIYLADKIDNVMSYRIQSDATKSAFAHDLASCSSSENIIYDNNEREDLEKRRVYRERIKRDTKSNKLMSEEDQKDESCGYKSGINKQTSETEEVMIDNKSNEPVSQIGQFSFESRLSFWRRLETNERQSHVDRDLSAQKTNIKHTTNNEDRRNTQRSFPATTSAEAVHKFCPVENDINFLSFCEQFSKTSLADLSNRNTRRNAIRVSSSSGDEIALAEIQHIEEYEEFCNGLPLETKYLLLRTDRKRQAVCIMYFGESFKKNTNT